jgi:hypothetical protein
VVSVVLTVHTNLRREFQAQNTSYQLRLLNLLLLIFGTELITGITLIVNSHIGTAVNVLGGALVSSLLVGIARAWELVGDRSASIFTSIGFLTEKEPDPPDGP